MSTDSPFDRVLLSSSLVIPESPFVEILSSFPEKEERRARKREKEAEESVCGKMDRDQSASVLSLVSALVTIYRKLCASRCEPQGKRAFETRNGEMHPMHPVDVTGRIEHK